MPEYTYTSSQRPVPDEEFISYMKNSIAYHERRLKTYLTSLANWGGGGMYSTHKDSHLRVSMLKDAIEHAVAISTLVDALDDFYRTRRGTKNPDWGYPAKDYRRS